MVRDSESNSLTVSRPPSCKYFSTGELADIKLAIRRWLGSISVSIALSRLGIEGSQSRSRLRSIPQGPRDFKSLSRLSDLLKCTFIREEIVPHQGSQSTGLRATSY